LIKNILIIEDDPGDQKLIKLGLKRISENFVLLVIGDGEKAVEFIDDYDENKNKIDLILLDLNLPRVGGMDVLAKIVNNKLMKEIPVVILSTSDVERNQNSELLKHVWKYYSKPATIEAFFSIIDKIFKEDIEELPKQEKFK